MTISKRTLKQLVFLALTLPLSACGGGLFGTGDGSPIGTVDINVPPANVNAMDTASFMNLDVVTEETDALVNVLNYSTSNLVVRVDTSNSDSEIIAAGSNSTILRIAPDTHVLTLLDSEDSTVFTFEPFTVAAQSLSTIIVRESGSTIRVDAVRTEVIADDTAIVKVRLMQIGNLGDASLNGDVSLLAGGDNPGVSDIVFTDLDFNVNAITEYVIAGSGDYVLNDAQGRVSDTPITLDGGSVNTILLIGQTETDVVLLRDSDLVN